MTAAWSGDRGAKWLAHLAGMEATLAPVDEPLVDALRMEGPVRVADLGCGGGATALTVLRRAPAGSVVRGFDVSPALVDAARRRTRRDGALRFTVADVATAAVDRPYDRLVSRFGVTFFDDPAAAFANLARWLAPGGRFAFAVWGRPSENAWMTSVRDEVARVVHVPRADPDAPGPFRYAAPGDLVALLHAAGFRALDVTTWTGLLPIGGALAPSDAARFALASFATFAELLADAGGEAREAAHRALTGRFARHEQEGAVRMEATVHVVTGAR